MTIALCYVCVTHGKATDDFTARFVATYRQFPAMAEHDLFVIANGGPIKSTTATIFSGIATTVFARNNDAGWDITGYMDAASGPCSGYDMMVCAGESVYFHREGWLRRFAEAWDRHGPGMYGPFSSNVLRGHLQTTCFATSPSLLRRYRHPVRNRRERYMFEHGPASFLRMVLGMGLSVRLVTWDGEWPPLQWRKPPNILWRGDQSNCLVWSGHTDRYARCPQKRKLNWERSADRRFT